MSEQRVLHCWTGYREWVEQTYGYASEQYMDMACSDTPSATCLLPDGHQGPHEWTNDKDIMVTFIGDPARSESERA